MPAKPIILVTRKLPDNVIARARRDYDARLNEKDELYDTERLLRLADGATGLLPCPTDNLSKAVIDRLPASIKIMSTYSVGTDHIDLAAAKARGIIVTNTPEVLTASTADVAMLLMLTAARRAGEGERLVRSGQWSSWTPDFMLGVDVTGATLGIFGMGRIGQAVAKRARGFDMKIHYADERRLPAELEQGAIYHPDADSMLPGIDFLSINCPLTPQTHHWLNAERIALMKPSTVVVNSARGPIVDDAALIAALKGGRLRAAGLDVFEGEPKINPGYLGLDNAFLLPHLGSATLGTRDGMGFRALDNLDAYFAGRPPRDRVA
jgi:lactate dehydrogenase-like 2-hydroxyacid dehydrogenase